MNARHDVTLLQQVDESFRRALWNLPVSPTRFYLNLTEACQLRCAHCITGAPERTASGTARHMPDSVVEALRPHFKNAQYVAFTHSGEPITSPAFKPVMQALKEARGERPYIVHLLTNGQAMTEARFAECIELGVTSMSFSVDGMSAQTHDTLRIGSHIARLLPRIAQLSAWRRKSAPHVRLGIAFTVGKANAHEVPELVRFVAASGLDWVKLEEMYPVNELAASQMLEAPGMAAVVADALGLAASTGVRLLDHTDDVQVWKCRLGDDARMARFSELDDYANRMEINPCRVPYEVCCVEPDGAVKLVSFQGPIGGNVLEQDLVEIWNCRLFQTIRKQSIAARLCLSSGATCAADGGPLAW